MHYTYLNRNHRHIYCVSIQLSNIYISLSNMYGCRIVHLMFSIDRWCICNSPPKCYNSLPTCADCLPTRMDCLSTLMDSLPIFGLSTNYSNCLPTNQIVYHIYIHSLPYPVTQILGMPMLPYSLKSIIGATLGFDRCSSNIQLKNTGNLYFLPSGHTKYSKADAFRIQVTCIF